MVVFCETPLNSKVLDSATVYCRHKKRMFLLHTQNRAREFRSQLCMGTFVIGIEFPLKMVYMPQASHDRVLPTYHLWMFMKGETSWLVILRTPA